MSEPEYTYLTAKSLIVFLKHLPPNKIIGIPRPGLLTIFQADENDPGYFATVKLGSEEKKDAK